MSLLSAKLIEREDRRFLVDSVIYRDVFSRSPMIWFSSEKEAQEQCLQVLPPFSITEKLKVRQYYRDDVRHYLGAHCIFKNKLAEILMEDHKDILLDGLKRSI